jgi:NADH dehydrogenase
MADEAPRVVIVGAGFAGLYAALALRKAKIRLTVVDRRNHHLFQPLLYQVATAALNPSDIASPIRHILARQKNTSVVLAEVTAIDLPGHRVRLGEGSLSYDFLIVATGATHSYFGHGEWEAHAPGLKSIEDALEIRKRVFLAYEAAECETDPARRRAFMNFVIIGGGPTGVEMAGALAEISRHALRDEFRHIDPGDARIILVEGLPRVLPPYPETLSTKARLQLERLGVEVLTGARVTSIDAEGIALGGERIPARTVIWAAGVQASPLGAALGVSLDRAGRVQVQPDLTIPGHPEVFVIGDLAAFEYGGTPVPGVSPAAIQEGRHAAANILLALKGEPLEPFRYWNKGSFATIGRGAAVGDAFGTLQLSGLPAWIAWLVIHIFFLIGFRNRVLVILQWAFSYLTFRRGARLITGIPTAPPHPAVTGPPSPEPRDR